VTPLRTLLGALCCALAGCRCPLEAPDSFLADYADYVQAPDRMGASLASSRSIAPASLFAAAALLQIDDADEKLQEDLVAPNAPEAGLQPADYVVTALVGTALLLPFLAPPKDLDVRPWTVAATNLEAWAWTLAITQGVKSMNLRDRPNGNPGGFFSSHASTAFSAATVLDREYGPRVGVPAYILASFVGYDRIRTNLHYPGDVLVGAGFGILMSNLIYDKDLGTEGYYRRHYRVEAMPVVDEETMGFQLSIRW
jgi:hypothetical protein